MNILVYRGYPEIRTAKICRALRVAGHTVDFVGLTEAPIAYPTHVDHTECFDHTYRLVNPRDLWIAMPKYDIVLMMNPSDGMAVYAMAGEAQIPVIFGVNDMLSSLVGGEHLWEKAACQWADGLIFVSKTQYQQAAEKYGIPEDRIFVLPNYTSEVSVPTEKKEKLSSKDGKVHLVYVGTLTPTVHHRYLLDWFVDLLDQGACVHVYPSSEVTAYENLGDGYFYNKPISPAELSCELGKYDAGLISFRGYCDGKADGKEQTYKDQVLCNLPHKLFDYWTAELPILAPDVPGAEYARLIEHQHGGLLYSSPEDCVLKAKKIQEDPEQFINDRAITMEEAISGLVDFIGHIKSKALLHANMTIPRELVETYVMGAWALWSRGQIFVS